jgi:protein-disulfide isomerase
VLDEYPDTVKLVVKPFPEVNNQSSLVAASAALAAHAQGKFWEFRERLFLLEGPLSVGDLHDIAEQVDIDIPRFSHDLSSDPILELLGRGINAGILQGVRGTPTVFVNQTPMTSLRIEDFRQTIRKAALQ